MDRPPADAPLERASELERMRALLAPAAAGRGAALAVVGPAGIGKTRLLGCLRVEAGDAGMIVLAARGTELERGFGFGVARQLFEPLLVTADDEERERLLDGAARFAAGLVAGAPDGEVPSDDPSFRALHGLYWLTANLAERSPVLLAIDDLQWSDAPTLRFLAYLTARLDGLPVIVGSTVRSDESGAGTELMAAVMGAPQTAILRPAPLSEAAVGEIVAARLGEAPAPGFVSACHTATGGNPFLLQELITALSDDGIPPTQASARIVANVGPDTISNAALVRLGRLGRGAHALARAVAVLGEDVELRDAVALAGVEERDAARTSDDLVTAGILRAGRGLSFVHPIVAHVIREQIPPSDRAGGHAHAARVLEARGADPETVAAHLLETRPASDARVVEQLRRAASVSRARGSPEAAANYLERARAEPPPPPEVHRVLFDLGTCLAMLHRHTEAVHRLLEALAKASDARERALITRPLAAILMLDVGTVPDAVRLLDEAASALPPQADDVGARLEGDIVTASFLTLQARRAAMARTPRFAHSRRPQILAGRAMTKVMFEGPADASSALAHEALSGGRLLAEETSDSTTYWLAAMALLYSLDLEGADAAMTQGIQEATARGSARGIALGSCFRARSRILLGRVLEAEDDARRFLELMPDGFGLGPAYLVDSLIEQGRYDEADEALRTVRPATIDSSMFHFQIVSRAHLKIRRGDPDHGIEELGELARGFEGWGTSTPGPLQWRPMAAEALAAIGDQRGAERMIASEMRACISFGSPVCLGIALRAEGVIRGGDEGLDLLDRSASTLAPTSARLEHAKTLVEMGAALRRARRPGDARGWLAEGMKLARRCGAVALAERAYEELQATGARPRRIVRTGVEALTPTERRICRMAGRGMSNRDIAQDLFITVRTVETHLASSYRKLDISSRTQLAGRMEGAETD